MNLKTVINKKGSYILEATVCLPIFIIALIVMCSVILMYACIEDANYITATELRRGAAEAITVDSSGKITNRINERISCHSQVRSLLLEDFRYRETGFGQDELISVSIKMKLSTDNPMDLASSAEYDVALITRAYVGKVRKESRMSAEDFMSQGDDPVYIFPRRGEKYHNENCQVLSAACRSGVLTDTLKKKYASCPVCHSRTAENGALVYYFPAEGADYHLPGCATLERNYIEIEKSVAVERGYDPCSKCGG